MKSQSAELQSQIDEDDQAFLDSLQAETSLNGATHPQANPEADPIELAARALAQIV